MRTLLDSIVVVGAVIAVLVLWLDFFRFLRDMRTDVNTPASYVAYFLRPLFVISFLLFFRVVLPSLATWLRS